MNIFLRKTISKLCNVVSAPVTATRDALAERLQSVRDTTCITGLWRIWVERYCRKRSRRRGKATARTTAG